MSTEYSFALSKTSEHEQHQNLDQNHISIELLYTIEYIILDKKPISIICDLEQDAIKTMNNFKNPKVEIYTCLFPLVFDHKNVDYIFYHSSNIPQNLHYKC